MKTKVYLIVIIFGTMLFCIPNCSNSQTNVGDTLIKKTWFVVQEGFGQTWDGMFDTNSLSCEVRISNDQGGIGLRTPTFVVSVNSKTTNHFDSCWRHYPTNYLEIELLDSTGKLVKRKTAGELYKQFPSPEQVEEAFLKCYRYSHRRTVQGFSSIEGLFARLSLPDLFELEQPGEYTLKVRMRLLEHNLVKPTQTKFRIWPLPEVSAKVQIRSNEIAATNSIPNN